MSERLLQTYPDRPNTTQPSPTLNPDNRPRTSQSDAPKDVPRIELPKLSILKGKAWYSSESFCVDFSIYPYLKVGPDVALFLMGSTKLVPRSDKIATLRRVKNHWLQKLPRKEIGKLKSRSRLLFPKTVASDSRSTLNPWTTWKPGLPVTIL